MGSTHPYDDLDVLVIANPASGQSEPVLGPLGEVFGERGTKWQVAVTREDLLPGKIARAALDSNVRVIAVYGGDGTVSAVAGAMVNSGRTMGLLPGGTGNGLARDLGIPIQLADAAALVADSPAIRAIDVVECTNGAGEQGTFILRAVAGLEAEMVLNATREEKQRLGDLAYFVEALRAMGDAKMTTWHFEVDGKPSDVEATSVAIANAGFVAPGSSQLVEGILVDDGRIEAVGLVAEGFAQIAAAAGESLIAGQSDRVVQLGGTHIALHAPEPQALVLDGEPFGTTPLTARVLPRALNVIVPAAASAA